MKNTIAQLAQFIFMLSLASSIVSCSSENTNESENTNLEPIKSWRPALLLENGAGTASNPQVVTDISGNAIAVWQQLDNSVTRIWQSRYSNNGEWTTPKLLKTGSTVDASVPLIATNPAGDAAVIWTEGLEVWSNFYSPVTGWGAAELLENNNPGVTTNYDIAIDVDGNVTVIWSQYVDPGKSLIWVSQHTPGIGWGIPNMIADDIGWAKSPKVAIADNGNLVATWAQSNNNNDANTWVSYNRLGFGWEAPKAIGNDNIYLANYNCSPICVQGSFNPAVATKNDFDSIVIWNEFDTNDARSKILFNRSVSLVAWDTPREISTQSGGNNIYSSNVALDSDGNALAVWVQGNRGGNPYSVWGNRYSVGAGWGTAGRLQTGLSGGVGPPAPLPIEFDENGRAIVLWTKRDQTGNYIWANHFDPIDGWSPDTLVQADTPSDGRTPDLAVSPNGNAVAIWSHGIGGQADIWVSHFK